MQRGNPLTDLATAFFVFLTVSVCVIVGLLLGRVVPVPTALVPRTPTIPATSFIPTETPSATSTSTPEPTVTPLPTSTRVLSRTPTPSYTPSNTPLPTNTQSPTNTFAPTRTLAPTNTPIPPTATSTFTATLRPTRTLTPSRTLPPTRDPNAPTNTPEGFPFRFQRGAATANFVTDEQCSFQGVGGQVNGLQGIPLTGLTVAVSTPGGQPITALSGSSPRNGPSGWLVKVGSSPFRGRYEVELRNKDGVAISPKVTVDFTGQCESNLILVNFFQTRPF